MQHLVRLPGALAQMWHDSRPAALLLLGVAGMLGMRRYEMDDDMTKRLEEFSKSITQLGKMMEEQFKVIREMEEYIKAPSDADRGALGPLADSPPGPGVTPPSTFQPVYAAAPDPWDDIRLVAGVLAEVIDALIITADRPSAPGYSPTLVTTLRGLRRRLDAVLEDEEGEEEEPPAEAPNEEQ